jgi:hypothetical protein
MIMACYLICRKEIPMKVEVQYQNGRRHGRESFTGNRSEILEAVTTLEESGYEVESLEEVEEEKTTGGLFRRITGSLIGGTGQRNRR